MRIIFLLALLCPYFSRCQPITIKGRIINAQSEPVAGATITIKRTGESTISDAEGKFQFVASQPRDTLIISAVGYETQDVPNNERGLHTIILSQKTSMLETVTLNTGYQQLPLERATGSFAKLGRDELNQQLATTIIARMEGMATGVLFDRNNDRPPLTVRGVSSIFADKNPLIILDNFPFEGSLENINPNDIESITILKDAAAASIWGARAGNGVIVLTTKKAGYSQPLRIGFNSNIAVTQKQDIYYTQPISSTEFVDVEEYLFSKGYYNNLLANINRPVVSPVVELLAKNAAGLLTDAEATAAINQYRTKDVRDDLNRFVYSNSFNQQYALNLSGGTNQHAWVLSGGLDKNENSLSAAYNRLTFRADNSIRLSNELQLQVGVCYTSSKTISGKSGYEILNSTYAYPYLSLADDQGNPLHVPRGYRSAYIDTAGDGHLLDWQYYFLDDYRYAKTTNHLQQLTGNIGLRYQLPLGLSLRLNYQNSTQSAQVRTLNTLKSFSTRDLINRFTQLNPATGETVYAVPVGDILDQETRAVQSHNLRAQLNYTLKSLNHELSIFGGGEVREVITKANSHRTYGYSDDKLTFAAVDLVNAYPLFINGGRTQIPDRAGFSETNTRFISFYANAGYTYLGRYSLTASARKDASNLFGVDINDKWSPLWSAGAAWKISGEKFYQVNWLPFVKFRLTYGWSGNMDPSRSAVTTIGYFGFRYPNTGFEYASVRQYPNPSLRWEKVRTINAGIDFAFKRHRFSGSLDYYIKDGKDLFGSSPIDWTAGFGVQRLTINIADARTYGLDFTGKASIIDRNWRWSLAVNAAYCRNEVTRYNTASELGYNYISSGSGYSPLPGTPLYSIISYQWAGLDSLGNPLGIVDGEKTKDYNLITRTGTTINDLAYRGSATPTIFGSVINTFSWKQFALAVNITYKFGYYFRREGINYGQLLSFGKGHAEFSKRWQKPGDELVTNVPSFIYPNASNRDAFYSQSDILVEKGDHLRWQYINLSYSASNSDLHWLPFENVRLSFICTNPGIIWSATRSGIDPDYESSIPPGRSYTIGLSCNL